MPGGQAFLRRRHVFAAAAGVVIGSLRVGGGVLVLGPLEAEVAGELVAEGVVFGAQAGVLGAGGVEPLAERVGGCALRGGPAGGWWLECLLAADEVADLVVAVEPSPGDPG
jgi:hypothetical protein